MAPGVPEKVAPHVPSKAAVRKAQKQQPHKPTVEGERRIHQSREQVSSERRRGRAARWGSGTPAAMVLIAPGDDRGGWARVVLHSNHSARCFGVGRPE